MVSLSQITGFEWDKGNIDKSFTKHGITPKEAEEVFLDEQALLIPDVKHSNKEERLIVIGKTHTEKVLFVVFTIRKKHTVRIISARLANTKERGHYETA